MLDTSTLVTLRPLKASDLEPVHALLSDRNVVRYMLLPHCKSIEESQTCLDDLIAENSSTAWRSVARAIEIRDSGEVIGLCGTAILHGSEQGEIWYLVSPDHWGRGTATEAARQLLNMGFSEMNLHRIFATCLSRKSGVGTGA